MSKNTNAPIKSSQLNFLQLAKQIRALNTDPKAPITPDTHIPLLTDVIEGQLNFIKSHLTSEDQKFAEMILHAEFERKKMSAQLSYRWWILFCYRLSILVTPPGARSAANTEPSTKDRFVTKILEEHAWLSDELFIKIFSTNDPFSRRNKLITHSLQAYELANLIQRFPRVILVPTIDGDVAIHDFNNALTYHVLPLGMIGKGLYADGQFFPPDRFYRHDIGHAGNWFFSENAYDSNTIQLFIQTILDRIKLENDERTKSQLEFMLFIATHEQPLFFNLYHCINVFNEKFYHDCLDDHYYALLIRPYLPNNESFEKETKDYLDETAKLLNDQIKEFFITYKIKNFHEKIVTNRAYKIEAPLSEKEIENHWTYNNPLAQKILRLVQGKDYPNSGFFHYLVKDDESDPEHKNKQKTGLEISKHIYAQFNFFRFESLYSRAQTKMGLNDNPKSLPLTLT